MIHGRRRLIRATQPRAIATAVIPRTPTFAANITQSAKPANHIPTTAPCTQCHTTASNYATYSVTGTHQGVTACLSCHAPTVASTFDNVTIVTLPANHIPIGSTRLQRLGLPYDDERERRRLQARQREHLDPDTECRRPWDGLCRGARLRHLSRDGALRGHAAEQRHGGCRLAPDGVRLETSDQRRLRQLPRDDADLRDRSVTDHRQTGQSHPDHRGLRAVPHHGGQLRALLGHAARIRA